jgi:hypothetical protein
MSKGKSNNQPRRPVKKKPTTPIPTEPVAGPSDQSKSIRTGLHELRPTDADLTKFSLTVHVPSAQNSEHQEEACLFRFV